jgi:hypothetical protein
MQSLVEIVAGSHLYGTSTPESDLDLKSVFRPDGRAILLQAVAGCVRTGTTDPGQRTGRGDLDAESFSIQKFLHMVTQGQTIALEMLFAPPRFYRMDPDPAWIEILDNRDRLLTRNAAACVSYCQQQAAKYGIKSERYDAMKRAVAFLRSALKEHGPNARLGVVAEELEALADGEMHIALVDHLVAGRALIKHLEVCNRMAPLTAPLKEVVPSYERALANYGRRAAAAAGTGCVDWKAMSHAIRVGEEALEFLTTGHITLPLPNAEHVLAVKKGLVPVERVGEEIVALLSKVEAAVDRCALPPEPDRGWIDNFVLRQHLLAVEVVKARHAA